MPYLAGSDVLYGGRTWTVLAIRTEGCLLGREGSQPRSLSVPATWRAYDALTATLPASERAERLPMAPQRPGRWH
jgi:hypothetical protein